MLKILATLAVAGALAFLPAASRAPRADHGDAHPAAQLPRLETSSGPEAPVRARAALPDTSQAAAIDQRRLEAIEPLVQQAIAEKKLPGAVVLIGRADRILYQKAIGQRALVPAVEPMSLDTMFDLASLTKVVATTTSVMI